MSVNGWLIVATALTVYGIETKFVIKDDKLYMPLQQYLPFTVLKLRYTNLVAIIMPNSCNSTYRLRYWNLKSMTRFLTTILHQGCNSTYRLRYWNSSSSSSFSISLMLQQYLPFTVLKPTKIILHDQDQSHSCVATVLTVYGIETILLSRLLVG